ncbi:MAG: hypothetical protein IPK99_10000 [Flavobacteriales bacterium]|nr:hypothetical protein [Flavobacteriales bacterium]
MFAFLMPVALAGQPFAIGERSVDFFDTGRNRTITCDVYHPADVAGTNVPLAPGNFPVLVMGHGFVMTTAVYSNFAEDLVPRGYILLLPTTEGGFAPAHEEFGLDLAFVAQAMQLANTDGASPFFGQVAPATALLGHSMGGGASFLGADGNPGIQTLVNFAAAETNPSAIASAANVQVPTLLFAASEDCVTPIADHQQPMYDALTVPCRALVTVTGGGHCYFAENSFTCSFGEATCAPDLTISREQQHDAVADLAGLWLDHFLKGDAAAFTAFQDSLTVSGRITSLSACLSTSVYDRAGAEPNVFPVPADDHLRIQGMEMARVKGLVDMLGRSHPLGSIDQDGIGVVLSTARLPNGSYHVVLDESTGPRSLYFTVLHGSP